MRATKVLIMSFSSEVRPRAKHRTFTAEEKVRILTEYESVSSPLERAAFMRKEGIYSSLLTNWRKQLSAAVPAKRGRPPNPGSPEMAQLRKENERLQRRLEKSERTVAALGKAHALLQMIAGESNADEERSKES